MAAKEWYFGTLRLRISLTKSERVEGVTSLLPDGQHILMWDFDSTTEYNVMRELFRIQKWNALPNIHVFSSGKEGGYHAYCLCRMDFLTALNIITHTDFVDKSWWKLSAIREYFTLRTGSKGGRKITYLLTLANPDVPEDVKIEDIGRMVQYYTGEINTR